MTKFCSECGRELVVGQSFCSNCGTAVGSGVDSYDPSTGAPTEQLPSVHDAYRPSDSSGSTKRPPPQPTPAMLGESASTPRSTPASVAAPTSAMPAVAPAAYVMDGPDNGDSDDNSGSSSLSPWWLLIPVAVIALLVGAFFFLKKSDDPAPVAAPAASPSAKPTDSSASGSGSSSSASTNSNSSSGGSAAAAAAKPTPSPWTQAPPHKSHQNSTPKTSGIALNGTTWDGTMNNGRFEFTMNISEGSGGALAASMYRRNPKSGKDGYQTLTGTRSGNNIKLVGQSWTNAPASWTPETITATVQDGEATRNMNGRYTCTGCQGSSDIQGYQDFS